MNSNRYVGVNLKYLAGSIIFNQTILIGLLYIIEYRGE